MEIPFKELDKNTLQNLVQEFVSREGTDYGLHIYDLQDKVNHVMRQLEKGSVFIEYDAQSSSCNIVKRK